jgi:hypothetical protein
MTIPYQVWNTTKQQALSMTIEPIAVRPESLCILIHSSVASMQFVEVNLLDKNTGSGYRAQIVVEWSGPHLLVIPINWFKSYGTPCEAQSCALLSLNCWDKGPEASVLTVGAPAWAGRTPIIPVNDREQLLECFTAPDFWEDRQWSLVSGEGSLEKIWLYAKLSTRAGEGLVGKVAYSKSYNVDIEGKQALIIGLSTDELSAISVRIVLDGVSQLAIDCKKGSSFEELRIPLEGKVLNSVTLELSADNPWKSGEQERKLLSFLYWFILENNGADPMLANEVFGSEDIEAPTGEVLALAAQTHLNPELSEDTLPIGFLIQREDLLELRSRALQGNHVSQRLFDDIRAEAEENLTYRPESYLGTYMPVDWARQGIERASSPNDDTHRMFSTLIYSAFAYAIEGDLRFGLAARRALLTVARIDHWAAGFVARYPMGIRGYRATFIEAHTSQAAALCYDFIYPLLSVEERLEVEEALYRKGVLWLDAFLRQNSEGYLLGSNQGAVYSLGLLYSAHVAKRSHPEAAMVAERWSVWLEQMIAGYYKRDGSTNEGMMYWEYTTHYAIESLLIISSQSNRSVSELIPPSLAQTMNYLSNVRSLAYPTLRFIPLGDCRNEDFNFLGPSLLFFARYLGDNRALDMWNNHFAIEHPPGSSFFGLPIGTGQYTSNGLLTLLLLQQQDEGIEAPKLPNHQLFSETERLFWRTGEEYGDKLLFFEGGPQSFEHTHYDKGQFVLEAFGEQLAIDPGTIKYNRPFSTLLKATELHNVVTVNRKDQSYKDASKSVVIKKLIEAEDYDFLHAELTNSYQELEAYQRRILFVRPDYWLILDEVESLEPGLEWNLHSKGVLSKLLSDGEEHNPDDAGENGIQHYIAQANLAGLHIAVVSDVLLSPNISTYKDEGIVLSHHLSLHTRRDVKRLRLAAVLAPFSGKHDSSAQVIEIQSKRSADGALFIVSGSFGTDRITCSFMDQVVRVERDNGIVITV